MRSWFTLSALSALLLVGAAGSARAGYTVTKTTPYPGVTHSVYTDASVPLRRPRRQPSTCRRRRSSCRRRSPAIAGRRCPTGPTASAARPAAPRRRRHQRRPLHAVGLRAGGPGHRRRQAVARRRQRQRHRGLVRLRPPRATSTRCSSRRRRRSRCRRRRSPSRAPSAAARSSCSRAWRCRASTPPTRRSRSARRRARPSASTPTACTMYLVTVDGDQAASLGHDRRASWPTSSAASASPTRSSSTAAAAPTLYVRKEGGVVNAPSDGVAAPGGQPPRRALRRADPLLGRRPRSTTRSSATVAKLINNATVTVDGQVATWPAANNHTLYHVDNIAPHYVCAHATRARLHVGHAVPRDHRRGRAVARARRAVPVAGAVQGHRPARHGARRPTWRRTARPAAATSASPSVAATWRAAAARARCCDQRRGAGPAVLV